MSLTQIILTIVFYIWLFVVLGLLLLHTITSSSRMKQLQSSLVESALKCAEAAQTSAESARQLVELVRKNHVE